MTREQALIAIDIMYCTYADISRGLGWSDQSGIRSMIKGRYDLTKEKQERLTEMMRIQAREILLWLETTA